MAMSRRGFLKGVAAAFGVALLPALPVAAEQITARRTPVSTTVEYGNVRLENVVTREFSQEPVYDESGTDLLYHKFTVTVQGTVHSQNLGTADHGISLNYRGANAAEEAGPVWNALYTELGTPRKHFKMTNGTTVILEALATRGYRTVLTDLNNGPKPRNIRITHIAGKTVYRVSFTVEICILHCEGGQAFGVLNNRWSIMDVQDANFFTTRTIEGVLQVAAGFDPQAFRALVVPALEDGFRRETLRFMTTPDGLKLRYSIVDTQIYTAAPWPATKISGTHVETTGPGGVAPHYSDVSVRLEGPPDADKILLIQAALQVIDNRINFIARLDDNTNEALIEHGALIDHIGEPAVEVQLRIVSAVKDESTFFGNLKGNFASQIEGLPGAVGAPEPYDPLKSRVPSIFGVCDAARLFFEACYLQSPCSTKHGIAQIDNPDGEDGDSEGDRVATLVAGGIASDLPSLSTLYSDEHKRAIYTHYKMDSDYVGSQGRVALPIARSTDDNGDAVAIVRLAPDHAKRIVKVEAERQGDWPEVPAPEDYEDENGIQWRLLNSKSFPAAPPLTGDARKQIFRLDSEATYVAIRTPTLGRSVLRTGRLPFTTVDNQSVPPAAYNPELR